MVSLSVCVKMMLFWNFGSMYGRMSSAVPKRAAPYSTLCRYFFAFLPFMYTAKRSSSPQTRPTQRSRALKLGNGLPNAAGIVPMRLRSFSEASPPSAMRQASPRLVQARPMST